MALEQNPTQSQSISGSFLRWRLRTKNGLMYASDEELEEASDICENFERYFAAVVIIGVLFEFFVAFFHPPYDTPRGIWGPVIGDAFVAIGLVVEVAAGQRVKLLQGELTRRSADRLAEAIRVSDELRVAMAWRRLTDEQTNALIQELIKAPPAMVVFRRMGSDPEMLGFMHSLRWAFFGAGWPSADSLEMNSDQLYGLAVPNDGGPAILIKRVRDAFDKIGLEYEINPLLAGSQPVYLSSFNTQFKKYETEEGWFDLSRAPVVSIAVFPKPMKDIKT